MLTHQNLLELSWSNLRSAKVVAATGEFDRALDLCGMAVETALKARITVDQALPGWPQDDSEFKKLKHLNLFLRDHDLERLLGLTKQQAHIKATYFREWSCCLQWKIETRYRVLGTAQRPEVESMLESAETIIRQIQAVPGLEALIVPSNAPPFQKVWALSKEMEIERGKFTLFALCNRQGAPESADLVASAHWIDQNSRDGARYIADRIAAKLTREEIASLSGLFILAQDHFLVRTITRVMRVEQGQLWLENPTGTINGLCIGKAFLMSSRAPTTLPPASS